MRGLFDIEEGPDDSSGFSLSTLTRRIPKVPNPLRMARMMSPSAAAARMLMRSPQARQMARMRGDQTLDAAADIAKLTPYGAAANLAYSKRRQVGTLLSFAKRMGGKMANAAHTLARAKSGDKKAKAEIMAANEMAKAGHPGAKSAMERLHAMEMRSKNIGLELIHRPIEYVKNLYHRGIA